MRILGLDLGARRIGLAVFDPEAGLALPSGILDSRGRASDISALCELIAEREVQRVVVGLPVHMNGAVGPEARAAQDFADALSEAAGIPVDTFDERWTSREAERIAELPADGRRRKGRAGRSARGRPGPVDDLAATLILQTYLDRRQFADDPDES